MEKVVIEQMSDDLFHIYNEAGQIVEPDFNTHEEATQWAVDNQYEVVDSFNV